MNTTELFFIAHILVKLSTDLYSTIFDNGRCTGWRTGDCPEKGSKRTAEEPPLTSGIPKIQKVVTDPTLPCAGMACKLEEVEELRGHSARVWDAQWNPTGTLLATCSGDKTIKIWGQNIDGKWECKTTLGEVSLPSTIDTLVFSYNEWQRTVHTS